MTVELVGYIALDEDDTVWGIGASEEEAEEDAWRQLSMDKPKHGAALDYYPCTQALLDYVRKHGGEDVPVEIFQQDWQMCAGLKDEAVEPERCPDTPDMFDEKRRPTP